MRRSSLAVVAMAWAGSVLAGGPEDDRSLLELDLVELLQIEVTAQRRVENIRDVPMAISVLPGEQLSVLAAAGDDIRLLSSRLPSLQVESSFGRTFPRFYLRGLGNTDFDLHASQPVSLVLDDVVQENPVLKGFPLFDLAQLEVARGPQGTLFGRNTPAGVVKFDSVRPAQEQDGYARLGWGRFGTGVFEGAIGGGLRPGLSARLSLSQQQRDDWVDNVRNGSGQDLEGYRDRAGRLQFLIDGREGFEALLNVHARSMEGTARLFRANSIAAGSNEFAPGFDRFEVAQDGGNQQDLHHRGGNLRLRWDFARVSLYSITGFESVELYSRGDIDGGFGASYFLPMGPGFIPFDSESAVRLPSHRQWSQELRVESREWGRFDWQAGLYYFDEQTNSENISYSSTFGGGTENGFARERQENTAWAVFASFDYDWFDRLRLLGGVRYTRDAKDFVAERLRSPFADMGVPDQLGPLRASPTDAHVSWDLSAVFELRPGFNAYARLAESFRAPSVQGRLLFGDSISMAETETVVSLELGIKADLMERRLRVGAGVFRYLLDNQQLTAVGGNANFNTLINADKVHGQGVEVEVEALPGERLRLAFGLSYNHTRVDDPGLAVQVCAAPCTVLDPTVTVDGNRLALIDGNPLPYAPRLIAHASLRYAWPVRGGEWYVQSDWAYRSAMNFFLYESREYRSDGLLEGGLRIGYGWRGGRSELALFVRNLTDQASLIGGIDFNNLAGMINEPRVWGLEWSSAF